MRQSTEEGKISGKVIACDILDQNLAVPSQLVGCCIKMREQNFKEVWVIVGQL